LTLERFGIRATRGTELLLTPFVRGIYGLQPKDLGFLEVSLVAIAAPALRFYGFSLCPRLFPV
jgi:hypothetical protein